MRRLRVLADRRTSALSRREERSFDAPARSGFEAASRTDRDPRLRPPCRSPGVRAKHLEPKRAPEMGALLKLDRAARISRGTLRTDYFRR